MDGTEQAGARRSFPTPWRSLVRVLKLRGLASLHPKFNDFDEEAETYSDYHTVQGIPTPYNITRYRNGDMVNQRFITKVTYDQALSPDLFNLDLLLKKP